MTLSKGKDTYYFPGGKREANESDSSCLKREIEEELSVDLIEDSLIPFGTYEAQAHGKDEGIIVKMTCLLGDFTGTPVPNNEIAEYTYFSYIDKDKASAVDQLIFEDLKKKGMID